MSSPLVGVISIQGDFEKHEESLDRLGIAHRQVRTPEDLNGCTHLIIPGGESTTVGMLMERFGLGQAIRERVQSGTPIWGTCMGLILLAREVEGRSPFRLELLDVKVQRNAFGAQVHSFETEVDVKGLEEPVTAVFIRAPVVVRHGPDVEVLTSINEKVVAVRQGHVLGTSYHPELTDDTRLHAWFCSWPSA